MFISVLQSASLGTQPVANSFSFSLSATLSEKLSLLTLTRITWNLTVVLPAGQHLRTPELTYSFREAVGKQGSSCRDWQSERDTGNPKYTQGLPPVLCNLHLAEGTVFLGTFQFLPGDGQLCSDPASPSPHQERCPGRSEVVPPSGLNTQSKPEAKEGTLYKSWFFFQGSIPTTVYSIHHTEQKHLKCWQDIRLKRALSFMGAS